MTDASNPPAAAVAPAEERDQMVEALKKQLAEKTEEAARNAARAGLFEEKERAKVTGFQSDAAFFIKEWAMGEADADGKADMAPMASWVDDFTQKKDIIGQTPLARLCSVASKGVKRLRDEASKMPEVQASLADTMQKLEASQANEAKIQKEFTEMKTHASEMQANNERLIEELTRLGADRQKFDFAKAANREADAAPPAEPASVVATTGSLETVTAQASKAAAAGVVSGNPLESNGFFDNLYKQTGGSLRLSASGTQHALLGAADVATDIASAIRMA